MRGVKAKSLRRKRPDRPNPGRKFGGENKHEKDRLAWVKSQILKEQKRKGRGFANPN